MAKAMRFRASVVVRAGCYPRAGRSEDSRGSAGRVEYLFDTVRNPETGKPYTNAEVARIALGDRSPCPPRTHMPNKPSQLLWFTMVELSTCAYNPGG